MDSTVRHIEALERQLGEVRGELGVSRIQQAEAEKNWEYWKAQYYALIDINTTLELQLAEVRESVAGLMLRNGFATGHGDTAADLLAELEWQVQDLSKERTTLRQSLQRAEGELEQCNQRVKDYQSDVADLEGANESLADNLQRVKPVFDLALQCYLLGDTQPLWDYITDNVDLERSLPLTASDGGASG